MAYALVGTAGAVSTGTAGAAVTPAYGTGESRTANNLLILTVLTTGSATLPAAPAGWSVAKQQAGTSCSASIFYKIAAGADAAPTVALIASAIHNAQLKEFSGGPTSAPLDQTAGIAGTTTPLVATTGGVDALAGELVIGCGGAINSAARANTMTHTINNAAGDVETTNGATSTVSHYDFTHGFTTTKAAADSDSFAFVTTQLTGAVVAMASFKLLTTVYTDSGSGTITGSGSGTESYGIFYNDSGDATLTASGKGFETVTDYDAVIDLDNPVSHWKLGDPNTALDRKQVTDLPATSGPIATASGLVTNNGKRVLDSFLDASAPRDLPTYNAAWSAPAVFGEFTPKTTVVGAITGIASNPTSAHYPSVSRADLRLFATVVTKPADGSWFELLARVQNPNSGTLNAYLLVGFANSGTDTIELWKVVGGSFSSVAVFQSADYSAGDIFVLDLNGTAISAYKNGVQIGSTITDSSVTGAGTVGFRLLDNTGALDSFGIGGDQSNQGIGTASAQFIVGAATGLGLPYEGPHTLEAWVKPLIDGDGKFVSRGNTALSMLNSGAGTEVSVAFDYQDSVGGTPALFGLTRMSVNGIHHVVGTHDGSTVILYLDGVEIRRVTGVNGNASLPTIPPHIIEARAGSWPRAVVDEVAWYSGALSAARVLAHYQAGTIDFYDALIDEDNPVSHWKLGESGAASAVDRKLKLDLVASNQGFTGSAISASGLLANNGVSAATEMQDHQVFTPPSTVYTFYTSPAWSAELWFKANVLASSTVIKKLVVGSGIQVNITGTLTVISTDAGGVTRFYTSTNTFTTGQTYHVVATHDGLTLNLYVNGVLWASGPCVGLQDADRGIIIGNAANNSNNPDLVIDEVAWYNTALSLTRVQAHYVRGGGILAPTTPNKLVCVA